MKAIQANITPGETGSQVANLQDALRLLLDRGVIRALEPPNQPSPDELARLGAALGEERAQSFYGDATCALVRILQIQQGLGDNLGGVVEARTADLLNRLLAELGGLDDDQGFVVRGRVTAAGAPAPRLVVRARDQDLRTSQPLGSDAGTDADGRYEIRYSAEEFARADAGSADLVVSVFGRSVEGVSVRPLVESAPLFNAPRAAVIDLEVPDTGADAPEFDRYRAAVEPLLAGQADDGGDLAIGDLTEADTGFLAGDTGIPRERIALLARSFAFTANVSASGRGQIPPALFYGWMREGQSDDLETLLQTSTTALRAAARAAITHGIIAPELGDVLDGAVDAIPNTQRAALRMVVARSGLAKQAAAEILQRAGAVSEINNGFVAQLVDGGQLSVADAHGVGLVVATHDLVDGDETAMAAILGALSARLQGAAGRARDLAALERADIEAGLVAEAVTPPDGLSVGDYADRIFRDVADRFPTDALLHRVSVIPDDVVSALQQIGGPHDGDGGRTAGDPALRSFANLHPGLELAEVIDGAPDGDTALATVRERVGWVEAVRSRNPDLDLLSVDYLPESFSLYQVNFDGLPDEARPMVAETFKAYQRLGATGVGALDQLELLKAGYRSATSLALDTPAAVAGRTMLPLALVRNYHARAEERASHAALAWFAFHDLERDTQRSSPPTMRRSPAYLQRLKGYSDLFGAQSFCHCEHCRSVLGPAAYFVDLMYYVERHVLDPSFASFGGRQHGLHLYRRRHDLWTLELTCANTTGVVPTLDLVNALLEGFIVGEKGLASPDALYARLADVDHGLTLPFSLPLERLSVWLGHLGVPRSEIADALLLRDSDAVRARIRLGMLPREYELVIAGRLGDLSAPRIAAAEQYYALLLRAPLTLSTIPGQTESRALDPIGVLDLTRALGVDVATAEAVVMTAFVQGSSAGAPPAISLQRGIGAAGGVQNDTELVVDATTGRLDRIERFARLWRHVPWTVRELDHVLGLLPGGRPVGGASNTVPERVVADLARLVAVQDRLQVSVEELCALVDELPTVPVSRDTALFDRLFTPAPDPADTIGATAPVRARIAGALLLDDADLTLLTDALGPCLGEIVDDLQGHHIFAQGLWTNRRNLSLLYRYARLASRLRLSVAELLATVALTSGVGAKDPANERCLLTLDDLIAVLETHRWRVASGFTIAEIQQITAPAGTVPRDGESSATVAAQLVADVAADRSLRVAPELFTQIGLTRAEAARLVLDNAEPVGGPGLLEPIPGDTGFRLRSSVRPQDVDAEFRFDPEPRPEVVTQVAQDVFDIVRRAGVAGFTADDITALGLTQGQAAALLAANTSTATADELPLEPVPGQGGSPTRFRLRPTIAETVAVRRFGALAPNVDAVRVILAVRARDVVTRNYADVAKEVFRIVRQAGDAGFAPSVFTPLGLSAADADALVAGNTSAVAMDELPFEAVPGQGGLFRRRATVSEAAALAGFADFSATRSILRHRAVALLLRYHADTVLAAKAATAARIAPERLPALLDLALPTADPARQAVREAVAGGPPALLADVLDRLARYAVLFRSPAFDAQALAFVAQDPDPLAVTWPPTGETVRRAAAYAALAAAPDPAYAPDAPAADVLALQSVLASADSVVRADTQLLARALRTSEREVQELLARIELATTTPAARVHELGQLATALALARRVGASTEILGLAVSEDTAELGRAADGVRAAIRARYADEASFQAKIEPFEDTLRSRTRDGLVAYLLSAPDDATTDWRKRFLGPDDLYTWLLTDVMVEGCARTSKVVFATMTLQLYVHRVRMGLEVAVGPPVVAARVDTVKRQQEWVWRQNYQVWVANRRVFLFPETYLEPGLRDDKTPLFRELEDTLLQQQIGDAAVEDAYGEYLTGLDELSRLTIAGACYDDTADALHLFGATHHEPPLSFYRRIDAATTAAPVAGPWRRLTLQIPTRAVAPVLYEGRLYVFWVQTTTHPVNTLVNGSSRFDGYRHSVRVTYSMLRPDNAWTPAQGLRFAVGAATEDARTVLDPVLRPTEQAHKEELEQQIKTLTQGRADAAAAVQKAFEDKRAADRAVLDAVAVLNSPISPAEQPDEDVKAYVAPYLVPAWPDEMSKAGVTLDDGLITARRKLRLWRAEGLSVGNDASYHVAVTLVDYWDTLLAAAQAAYDGIIVAVRWDRSGRDHSKPLDNYRPEGWEWERVYPDVVQDGPDRPSTLRIVLVPTTDGRVVSHELDLFARLLRPVPDTGAAENRARLTSAGSGRITSIPTSTTRQVGQEFFLATQFLNAGAEAGSDVAHAPWGAAVQVVNGAPATAIVEADGEPVWLRPLVVGGSYVPLRLGTTVVPCLTDAFARKGVDTLLSAALQGGLTELTPPRTTVVGYADRPEASSPFWKQNVFLTYYRELFFDIAFLVADHLNSQQRFAEAQRWYHRIFDPTALDGVAWRYREFREVDPSATGLRATLTNPDALAAYRDDPFNPFAIARLRPGAFEKAIVMKYVDNLLDWGDELFARFTMESVNEATMLYVMAADVLGPRPTQLAECGESDRSRTYESIAPLLTPTSDFLIEEAEVFTLDPGRPDRATQFVVAPRFTTAGRLFHATGRGVAAPRTDGGVGIRLDDRPEPDDGGFTGQVWTVTDGTPLAALHAGEPIGGAPQAPIGGSGRSELRVSGDAVGPPDRFPELGGVDLRRQERTFGQLSTPKQLAPADFSVDVTYGRRGAPPPLRERPGARQPQVKPFELAQARLVFCFPENEELASYWDRAEDRLTKIRTCRDIAGVRRRLELFAPEIDPRLLVRMRAAGLSLADVLDVTSGNLPPYRFTYLVEKAKQHAALVQGFGDRVLSALEKRDAEELTRLRTVHEQNLLTLRSRSVQLEIDAAEDALAALTSQRAAALYRVEYFSALDATGLLAAESTHQVLLGQAGGLRTMAGLAQMVASILSIIPDTGSPWAMKFGGSQLGAAGRAVAEGIGAEAAFMELGASMAGQEGSNRRRAQEWEHQVETAKREVAQLDKQIAAAEIRRDIATEAQKVHERSLEQVEEIFDLLRGRFTSFGLFTWLSAELQKLHRMAFDAALTMARLAEQAYWFERPDEAAKQGLTGGYWDAGHAGLLAGDRLLLDLQGLERSYLETNYRTLEIEQSFSLARFAPDALSKLRTEAACEFEVPEWYFDLTYPGHYRRRIKAVRVTIPAVVGPSTNIGATLRLVDSHVRTEPRLESRVPVPLRHVTAIVTSMGQSDAGVFEFSFRDERYMPFEGAGVDSRWQLTLPKAAPTFDYATINEVSLRISYTAEEDLELRTAAELPAGLLAQLAKPGVTRQLSMRTDFRIAWDQLVDGAQGKATVVIDEIHVPFFLSAFDLAPTSFDLLVERNEEGSYPTASLANPSTAAAPPSAVPAGPDEDSGLWLLHRSGEMPVLGPKVVRASWPVDRPRRDDIIIRIVLRKSDG